MAIKSAIETINRMQADGVIGKYAIGGAVGATFYLEPAATVDLDVFVDLPFAPGTGLVSLAPIYEYLTARGCNVQGEYVVIEDWPVQFLPVSSDLERDALETAVAIDLEGTPTRVMTAEHLVAIAVRTGRTKDHARVLQFIELNAVRSSALEELLSKHGLLSKWETIQQRLK